MKFGILLEDLLNELSGDEIYQKYYSKIPYEQFIEIVSADPQSSVEGGKIQRMGKYAKLLITLFQKGTLQFEDLDKAKEYLEYVYQHKIPVDLGKIKQLGDLYNIVKDYIAKDTKSLEEILKVLSKDEFKVLHDGEMWFIFQPLTEKAACYLGVSTEWCTTWGPYSLNKKHKDRGNQFRNYSSKGPLFIMINKNNFDDKYQFHFETNQFMDKDDRRINTSNFFSDKNKSEVLYYFFPSLVRQVDENQLRLELNKIDILPEELGLTIFEKSIKEINNPLTKAILDKDVDTVVDLMQGAVDVDINDARIEITVSDLQGDVQQLEQNIGWYEYEVSNGWEFIYDDMRDRGMDEYEIEKLQEFLKPYYEENVDDFRNAFSVRNFDEFLKLFFDNYMSEEDILDGFWSDIADLSHESYESLNDVQVKTIEKDIQFFSNRSNHTISLNTVKFLQFILKKNITEIPDDDFLDEVLDDYVNYCGHGGEFERIYDYNLRYPKYGDNNYLTKATDKHFNNILENKEKNIDCLELRRKLNDIVAKYFKNSTRYENEHIIVRLKSMKFDCANGMVRIEYENKDTGERFGGWGEKDGVKIDNLVSLLTNYKLFESLIKFKKNI